MVDYVPQDEYFEWEDILVGGYDNNVCECDITRRENSTSLDSSELFTPLANVESISVERNTEVGIFCWDAETRAGETDPSVEAARPFSSAPPIKMPQSLQVLSSNNFQSYENELEENMLLHPQLRSSLNMTKDDLEAYFQPSRCVDYFAHQWSREEMSASWRHVRTKERSLANAERLENASWRLWAQLCFSLTTVSPQTVDWKKEMDDTCLYGPFKETSTKERCIVGCAGGTKPILKKLSISELLIQGSQLSWTGARRHLTGNLRSKKSRARRSVRFNHIIELSSKAALPKGKVATPDAVSPPIVASVPIVAQPKPEEVITTPSFWNFQTAQPYVNGSTTSSELSQWTWLSESGEDELDWISPQPNCFQPDHIAPPLSTASIVRDLVAKSYFEPKSRPQTVPRYEHILLDEEDEDEMMAQYLFDCDFKSDSDTLTPSESSSSSEDQDSDDAGFFDSADLADENRLIEKLHEIPMMERMKKPLFEQVVNEVSAKWE